MSYEFKKLGQWLTGNKLSLNSGKPHVFFHISPCLLICII